ncbi:LANO_0F11870g1_1 [Lachancea nothofagi CBS 11611]|uniref:LANO_0F11870g1_1 n=1 Tax=Lachancea nothofagi CBS 11611 TaxID=1266666 RepID=A0A1G4KB17_9SACH|nr:LANO_0F11870g1_1 [Lachancea nothofagi CBS 11611]
MITFAHKGKSKRPKFLFNLKIFELTNIPQSSGYCFVKWHLKDGTGTTSHAVISNSVALDSQNVRSSSQSRGTTARVLVKHHRAHWNYNLPKPVQVKLTSDKFKQLHPKELVLEVYFEFLEPTSHPANDKYQISDSASSSNSVYTKKVSRKVLLGVVEVNIAEYINKEQNQVPSRFLLQKSKVNSILSIAIHMELTRGSFDDFQLPQYVNSGQLPNAFRNGITEVFEGTSDVSSPASSTSQSNSNGTAGASNGVSPTKKTTDIQGSFSIAINNPFVEKLYQRTFQIPWDPRPGELTPKECVEDILEGGDGWAKNEKGINLIDIDALHLMEMERNYDVRSNGVPGHITHGEFDRRLFLEKRVGFESQTNTQKRGIGGRKNLEKTDKVLCEDDVENYDPSKLNNFKSWTISKILP